MNSVVEARPERDWLSAIITTLVVGAAYWVALPDHVQAGDSGEFATIMLRGGIPHPPGYPWMRVLGEASSLLEWLGVAPMRAAALPCAVLGVAAWVLVQRTLARWGLAWTGAWAACLGALASTPMLHVPDAEVFGPHLFACAVFVRYAAQPRPRAFVLGLLFGLAATQHLTAVLLVPLAAGAAWPAHANLRAVTRAGLDGVGGTLLGLTAYFMLLSGTGGAWRWGDLPSAQGLWRHVTRADYGTLSLSLQDVQPPISSLIGRASSNVAGDITVGVIESPALGAAFLAALLIACVRLKPPFARSTAWLGLLATVVTVQALFPAIQNLDPDSPFASWILERFDLLPLMLWTLLLASAVGALTSKIEHPVARGACALAGAGMVAAQLLRSLAHGTPADGGAVEAYARDVLASPAPDTHAVVFGTDDHRLFPILYLQAVAGQSENVTYVDASLLSQSWYRQGIRGSWSDLPEIGKPVRLISSLWHDPARRNVPVYLANVFSHPAREHLRLVPEGVLWRVVPPHAAGSPQFEVAAVLARHRAALGRLGGARPSTHPGHPWAADVAGNYLDTHRAMVRMLTAAGRDADAAGLAAELDAILQAPRREP